MTTETEAFYTGGVLVGAVLRCRHAKGLDTRSVFRPTPDADIVQFDQQTVFGASVTEWSSFSYQDSTGPIEQTGTRDHDGSLIVDGLSVSVPAAAVPSYAAHPLLQDWLATEAPALTFSQFREGGAVEIQSATFLRSAVGTAEVTTPWGAEIPGCTEVQLLLDDRPDNTFWCTGNQVVKSDWRGAESYAIAEPDAVLADLDPEVSESIRDFYAHHAAC